jgi:predicted 2-oxoglutarate/Fe(II)-dependent dioxygenase YbiX
MEKNSPEVFSIMSQYINEIQNKIEYKFGRRLESTKPGIRKWVTGEYTDLHADGETASGWPAYNYKVDYGSIIYLNEEYEGGEIFFPKYEICLKPKPGTLIFFPSNNMYAHGVRHVTSGVRFTSAHFWVPTKHKMIIDMAKNNAEEL